jgi:hypothetical protein
MFVVISIAFPIRQSGADISLGDCTVWLGEGNQDARKKKGP